MKKLIILISLGLFSIKPINAMEEQSSDWEKLPAELKSHILSFVPEPSNYKNWINAMKVSKEFHSLLTNAVFLKDFARRLTTYNLGLALNS